MDLYLVNHYKGKYRVKAHYDKFTNDFVRDDDGNLEESFGDFYLSGRSGIEVKHGTGSELSCYIPKLQLGNNILKQYYSATTMKSNEGKSVNKIVEEMKNAGYINDCDILSTEVFFTFDAKHLDALAPVVKLKTSGAKVSPFSTRNLPKRPYVIPDKDIKKYKKAKEGLTGLEIGRIQEAFITECFDKDFKSKMRKEMLKATFTLGAPQIIWLTFVVMSLGVNAIQHGKNREDKYNFWAVLISFFINVALLWWGGFFS